MRLPGRLFRLVFLSRLLPRPSRVRKKRPAGRVGEAEERVKHSRPRRLASTSARRRHDNSPPWPHFLVKNEPEKHSGPPDVKCRRGQIGGHCHLPFARVGEFDVSMLTRAWVGLVSQKRNFANNNGTCMPFFVARFIRATFFRATFDTYDTKAGLVRGDTSYFCDITNPEREVSFKRKTLYIQRRLLRLVLDWRKSSGGACMEVGKSR